MKTLFYFLYHGTLLTQIYVAALTMLGLSLEGQAADWESQFMQEIKTPPA